MRREITGGKAGCDHVWDRAVWDGSRVADVEYAPAMERHSRYFRPCVRRDCDARLTISKQTYDDEWHPAEMQTARDTGE